MNDAVREMLKQFGPTRTPREDEFALREILQRISLFGLHRGGFFKSASFYGGTALRILYNLDRFSEDMDFCLDRPDMNFSLQPYFSSLLEELERFGFHAQITEKRSGPDAAIESAFVKQSTYQGLLSIGSKPNGIHKEQLVKIRIEVDKSNPPGGLDCKMLIPLPVPFLVRTLTLPSLFAGKLHAILARTYLNRVKGRDYYDLLFYLARKTPVNSQYLESKLRDSGHYQEDGPLTKEALINLLCEKLQSIDFEKAKQDVLPFIKESNAVTAIDEWSAELFLALVRNIELSETV